MTNRIPVQTPIAEEHIFETSQILRVISSAELEAITDELTRLGLVHVTNSSVPHIHEFRLQESLKCNFCDHLWWGRYAAIMEAKYLPAACEQCGRRFRYNYTWVRIWNGQHYRVRRKDESAPLGIADLEEDPLPVPRRVRVYLRQSPLSDEQLNGAALGLTR